MTRRSNEVLGHQVQLVPTWSGVFDESMAGDVMLPGENARIAPMKFGDWLAQLKRSGRQGGGMTTENETSSEGVVVVAEAGPGTYTQRITAGQHELISDEPQPIGDDAGPTPYDLLLSALGACTSMTVRMYADRKGWQLDSVRVTLRHSRIHAKDCADCETSAGWVGQIDREVELSGNLDDGQRQLLLNIAERCPVHQTLTSEIRIATSLR